MTGNQASPAQAGLPAPQTATAHPHDAAGHHAIGRRPADLPLAAVQKKTARYAPLLLGGAAAAVLAVATQAMASTTGGRDTASAVSISAILGRGDVVTGVRGTTDGNVRHRPDRRPHKAAFEPFKELRLVSGTGGSSRRSADGEGLGRVPWWASRRQNTRS